MINLKLLVIRKVLTCFHVEDLREYQSYFQMDSVNLKCPIFVIVSQGNVRSRQMIKWFYLIIRLGFVIDYLVLHYIKV